MNRRRLFAGGLGLSAAGCRPAGRPDPERVSIVRSPAYGQHLYELVRRLITEHDLSVRGKRVVIKPNLVEFDQTTVINSHPLLVHAVLEGFRAAGAADVKIAEGPGHRRITLDLADAAGYFDLVKNFEDNFVDLNLDDVSLVRLRKPSSKLTELYLPNTILGCDLLVSVPKMKTHHWVGATLAMKNFFGLVPGAVYGWPKNVLHWAGIDECIADIYKVVPPTFAIVDGITGMEGNGPIQGTPKHAGVVIAGRNLPAVDATCCRIMGINPEKIKYLSLATDLQALRQESIRQIGEQIASVVNPFSVIPEWNHVR